MTVRPYPFADLRRVSRREAALESQVARWLGARGGAGARLESLVGGPVRARVTRAGAPRDGDPHGASCALRVAGQTFDVRGSGAAVRALAQRLLGGPSELAAPRPLGAAEQAIWALVVATAVEDLGIPGEVWPHAAPSAVTAELAIELAIELGQLPLTAVLHAPAGLVVASPPCGPAPAWTGRVMLDVPILLGRCALPGEVAAVLAVRDVVTLERPAAGAELAVLGGAVGIDAAPGAVVAEVATGYVRRDVSLPDDAHVELSVTLGTTQLSLRQVFELSIGQIVPLGRPLAGPFEVRAAGRRVGQGELVDVDGELGVRIVSLDPEGS